MSGIPETQQRYHRWQRKKARITSTWFAIVWAGLKHANKDSQARAFVWMSLAFVVGTCTFFYGISLAEDFFGSPTTKDSVQSAWWYPMILNVLGVNLKGVGDVSEIRTLLWRTTYMLAIKVQLFWVLLTLARVGPGLIADDLRARALPIYFSRPLTPFTYLTAKWAIAASYVGMLVLVPNILSLMAGVLITGGLATMSQTFGLTIDLLTSGLGMMLFGGLLILAISSATPNRRFATAGWFAICLLPSVAQAIVNDTLRGEATTQWLGAISLRGNIMILTEWLFDIRIAFADSGLPTESFERALLSPVEPAFPAVVLGSLTIACALLCYVRVVSFSRSAASM